MKGTKQAFYKQIGKKKLNDHILKRTNFFKKKRFIPKMIRNKRMGTSRDKNNNIAYSTIEVEEKECLSRRESIELKQIKQQKRLHFIDIGMEKLHKNSPKVNMIDP